jgi:hypothetical protein
MFFDHEIQDFAYCVPMRMPSRFFSKKGAVSNIDKTLPLRHYGAMKNPLHKTEGSGIAKGGMNTLPVKT